MSWDSFSALAEKLLYVEAELHEDPKTYPRLQTFMSLLSILTLSIILVLFYKLPFISDLDFVFAIYFSVFCLLFLAETFFVINYSTSILRFILHIFEFLAIKIKKKSNLIYFIRSTTRNARFINLFGWMLVCIHVLKFTGLFFIEYEHSTF